MTYDKLDYFWARLGRWLLLFALNFIGIWGGRMWKTFAPHADEAFIYAFCRAVWTLAELTGQRLNDTDFFSKDIIDYLNIYWVYWDEQFLSVWYGSLVAAAVFASLLLWLLVVTLGVGPKKTGKERFRRGAQMVGEKELNKKTRVSWWNWWRREERAKQLFIGGVAIPVELENENFLFSGRPKMGKTQAVKGLGVGIRQRGQRAIVADPDSAFLISLARNGDKLLNLFDSRSANWGPFVEIEEDFHHELMAKAVIPDASGSDSEWRMYAQQLYAAVSRQLLKKGEATTAKLLYFLTQSGPKELGELIEGDIAAQIAAKGNEKMFSNTRAVLSMFLSGWRYLPENGNFSVRKWIRQSGTDWLFLPYRDDQWPALRSLASTWITLAISEGLTLPPDPNRRIWYLVDELASLERLANLEDGANKLRKHGGCLVGCVQSIAQLRERYGTNTAQSILSSFGTWLILGAGDADTAEAMSRHLGQQEIERDTHSTTKGEHVSSTAGVLRENRSIVLPAQIQNLPSREGYLALAGHYPTAYVEIPVVHLPDVIKAFVPRTKTD